MQIAKLEDGEAPDGGGAAAGRAQGPCVIYADPMDSPPTPPGDVTRTAVSSPSITGPASQGDYLLCIEGERSWTVAIPPSGELVIGRGPDASLRLGDELVSRAHAQLLVVPDGIRLADLGSRHGTLVNGQPLAGPRLLASGDVITVGTALLIVHRPQRASAGRALLDGPALSAAARGGARALAALPGASCRSRSSARTRRSIARGPRRCSARGCG